MLQPAAQICSNLVPDPNLSPKWYSPHSLHSHHTRHWYMDASVPHQRWCASLDPPLASYTGDHAPWWPLGHCAPDCPVETAHSGRASQRGIQHIEVCSPHSCGQWAVGGAWILKMESPAALWSCSTGQCLNRGVKDSKFFQIKVNIHFLHILSFHRGSSNCNSFHSSSYKLKSWKALLDFIFVLK